MLLARENSVSTVDTKPNVELKPIELTVLAPCFNERENVSLLVGKLTQALDGIEWEVIFVDDNSPDGTAAEVRALAQKNPRVRCIQRIGRRGLSTAVIEGMLASSAPFMAVIDADLQHDETLLLKMAAAIKNDQLDVVVGSRYVSGGSIGGWGSQRAAMSRLATSLAKLVLKQDLRDPMSGYFMLTRSAFEKCVGRLSGQGYKILLDIFASSPEPLRFKEIGYTFRERQHGESKIDSFVLVEYVFLLLDKLIGWLVPVRFIMFAAVGASGVFVHLLVLRLAMVSLDFTISQAIATLTAMTSNYLVNNVLTYRDRRLRGRRLVTGMLTFYAVCGIGAVANVGVAATLFKQDYSWWLAGLGGIAVGVVWNYAMTAAYTWKVK